MLRISKLTDYGVVLCTHLASEGRRSVRSLHARTAIPEPTIAKVLKALTRSGVVTSTRGASGGYALSRSADEVSVADIISALEGPIAVTECTDESAETSCTHEPECGVRTNWQRINDAVQSALSNISLAEMTSPVAPLIQIRRASS